MGRDQVRIVIAFHRIDVVAPRRLDRHGQIAEPVGGQDKGPVDEERIGLRRPPSFPHLAAHFVRQAVEELPVVVEGNSFAAFAFSRRIGRPFQQDIHQRRAVFRGVAGFIAIRF